MGGYSLTLNTSSKSSSSRGLTHEYLLEHFKYDPDTGELFRIKLSARNQELGLVSKPRGRYNYARLHPGHNSYRINRVAYFYMTGEWPKGVVDHIDGNPLNDSWDNLRDTTQASNVADAYLRNGKDLPTGITMDNRGRYKVRGSRSLYGNAKFLGYANSLEEAMVIKNG